MTISTAADGAAPVEKPAVLIVGGLGECQPFPPNLTVPLRPTRLHRPLPGAVRPQEQPRLGAAPRRQAAPGAGLAGARVQGGVLAPALPAGRRQPRASVA